MTIFCLLVRQTRLSNATISSTTKMFDDWGYGLDGAKKECFAFGQTLLCILYSYIDMDFTIYDAHTHISNVWFFACRRILDSGHENLRLLLYWLCRDHPLLRPFCNV